MYLDRTKKILIQIGNIVAVILTILLNMLAVLLPLNGKTTQELSDKYPNLFVPAGFTFSIWSVIYILLVLFAVYQGKDLLKTSKQDLEFLDTINIFFIIASAANIAWIFAWHYEILALSLVFMVILLLSLIAIYLRLNIGKSEASRNEKIFVHVPMSVYLGWITIATIANITAILISLGVEGFDLAAIVWTNIVLIVALLITTAMLIIRKDIAYSLVVIWATFGIFSKQLSINIEVAIMAFATMIIVMILVVLTIVRLINKK
ncbi:MAG: hypothetical protein JW891_17200 [Candidatus Lokiarchaeota archaeon]|nr:hypothetical protein [Candidatus Lokiarchaeota archaeon]